ncbi:hypothetical protein [Priestia filamentosa]|uniref:hypothetical protein n=1 Tax=Priestia filamentosa TaxID=1402861 RepID=UPI000E7311FB|nr:hypothetical protein [Priestia filamentosa]RJS63049.1 hypothetical protein CJ485_24240 [Priestia filamentosa]
MKKGMYRLSLCLTLGVFIFLLMKGIGFIFWINGGLLDKWVAIIGLLAMPTFFYLFLKDRQTKGKIIRKVLIGAILFHTLWLWWSIQKQPYDYTYAEKNQIFSTPYVIHETNSWEYSFVPTEQLTSTYIMYKSVNSVLFRRVSTHKEEPGLVREINLANRKGTKIDDYQYKLLLGK